MAWSKKMPIMDGLVCWLDGRDGNNIDKTSVWKDRSGNGNDATLYNVNFDSSSGWTGKSLKFDGVNDRFLFNYSHKGTSLTFETLCKINKDDATHDFLEGSSDSPSLYCTNANTLIFKWGTNNRPQISSTGLFKTGTLVHAFWVVDYEKNILKVIAYCDGVKKISPEIPITDMNETMFNTLGINSNGLIKSDSYSYKIYEKVLTEEEILHNYEYETKYKDNELFLDSEGLRHLTSKIKDTIPSLSTGLPVPYIPELALNGGLTCVYTGKKPIGYEKLNSGNCRPDGTFDADTDIAGQILEDGSIWFGVGTTNMHNINRLTSDKTLFEISGEKALKFSYDSPGGQSGWTGGYNGVNPISVGGEIGKVYTRSCKMFLEKGHLNINNIRTSIEGGSTNITSMFYDKTKDGTWQNMFCRGTPTNDSNNYLFYFWSKGAGSLDDVKGTIYIAKPQLEQQSFPTPYVDSTRKQTNLQYLGEKLQSIEDLVLYAEIGKLDSNYIPAYGQLCFYANNSQQILINYNAVKNKLISEGIKKLIFANDKVFIDGEVIPNAFVSKQLASAFDSFQLFLRNATNYTSDRALNGNVYKVAVFQKDTNIWTDEYCKLATTVGFDIPKCKETAPLYNTEPDTTGLLKYKESYRINDNSESFPIKPNCVYKMTDRNGKEFVNKTNASNAVSAGTGSTLIITNTAGAGKINTGSGYEYPIKVEVVIN